MKILVPIDGSKYSMESLKVAADFAKIKDADVYLMAVVSYTPDIDLEISATSRDHLLERMKAYGEEILSKAKQVIASYGLTKVKAVLSTSSSVPDEIIDFAEKEKIDLIVIGSRGMGATARFLIGSVSQKVVTNSPCSVYVVKKLPE